VFQLFLFAFACCEKSCFEKSCVINVRPVRTFPERFSAEKKEIWFQLVLANSDAGEVGKSSVGCQF
jgi:hypothetical protein